MQLVLGFCRSYWVWGSCARIVRGHECRVGSTDRAIVTVICHSHQSLPLPPGSCRVTRTKSNRFPQNGAMRNLMNDEPLGREPQTQEKWRRTRSRTATMR